MKKKRILNKAFAAMKDNICDTSCGLFAAPMEAQQALDILTSYLLGDNWYIAGSCNVKQANAVVVEQILDKYSKQWRDDWKYYEKNLI